MTACGFCGAVSRALADLREHSRTVCEQRILERIAVHEAAAAREREHLEALHAVKATDWRGALT